jgi:hypothetical protein
MWELIEKLHCDVSSDILNATFFTYVACAQILQTNVSRGRLETDVIATKDKVVG